MKIQGLAVLAIIIILPMTILLSSYTANQAKTLDLQVSYDSKLTNATYDAIKAFQLNMSNSSTSDLANSKMRDIKASVNTFYNSLASNFNMSGYGKDVLQNYVPAIVYTMYDGYYIYSEYKNTLDESDSFEDKAKYKNGDGIYGLKPYIYYSCRYVKANSYDVVITYSLDSYITVQGTSNKNPVNISGYLLSDIKQNGDSYSYRGVDIIKEKGENLKQNVYLPIDSKVKGETEVKIGETVTGSIGEFKTKKVNGVKYYDGGGDGNTGKTFFLLNDKLYFQPVDKFEENNVGIKYYKDAYAFKNELKNNGLLGIKTSDAVDQNGRKYSEYPKESEKPITGDYNIFGELNDTSEIYIEDENSQFNAHKLQVIRNSIESNLMVAISNYNNVSTSDVKFAMPKLQDEEWEKILKNISMVSFLQGLNIGGKVYNGYSIVTNDNTEDFVSENSIYILHNNVYHNTTDTELGSINDKSIGILNIDFQRRTAETSKGEGEDKQTKQIYYYPKYNEASYNSIINSNGTNSSKSISEYLIEARENPDSESYKLAQIYYTALGRERAGQYRVMNKLEKVQEEILAK